jgi:cellulose synthase/poly-beta-1,6-N-acetylglucosamine synthase-like glycosyltransferase
VSWAFWCAVALIAYSYAGYLGWLWLWSRWRRLPVQSGAVEPFVSIVMVVRDEERVLEAKMQNLLALEYPEDRMEVVVVSDGSTDRTEAILHEQARNPKVLTVLNQLSRGKAAGLNDGLQFAHGEIVIFTDARQKIEKDALRILLRNFADPQVGCVSGELMLGDPQVGEKSRGMGLYWRIEKKVRELESASGSVVGATGAFYGVRRELLTEIPPGTILDDVYVPMQVARLGKRVIFEPAARAWDAPDQGRNREFSRKVRTLSGNYQLVQMAPWLLSGQNPLRFRFISHKLLRLIVPFALIVIFVTSLWLQGPLYRTVLWLQVAFYALSLAAFVRMPRSFLLARAADAACTFVLLNTAALLAFGNFLAGRRVIWSR